MTTSDSKRTPTPETTRAERERSRWEGAVVALSAALVLGSIGYVSYKAVAERSTPPQITLQVEAIHRVVGGYVVELWAVNRGSTTAKDLAVEAQLRSDTGVIAVRSATITFVPAESRRKAGLFFPVDPRSYRLELYPVGYDVP